MLRDRRVMVLYVDAVCNLNCRYCYIDKNPSLIKIDKLLDDSFKGDYYFNFAKEIFPFKDQLTELQIWGGEPTLHLDRTHNVIRQLLEYYPNLETLMFSTNAATPNWWKVMESFMLNAVNSVPPDRKLKLDLQLSLDGPTEINDPNRGAGVTEKFINNVSEMFKNIDNILVKHKNFYVNSHIKSTLDISSIQKLQSKESILHYFTFLENIQKMSEYAIEPNFQFDPGVPNTACPSPHTKEDGILFANLCKLTREIEQENETKKYFSYYKSITPFSSKFKHRGDLKYKNIHNCGACGSGKVVVGLLPNDMISCCHNGFTELISDYKKCCEEKKLDNSSSLDFTMFLKGDVSNPMVFHKEHLKEYEKQVESFYKNDETFQIYNVISEIMLIAKSGFIDSKYVNLNKAAEAADFLFSHTAYCMRDNIGCTGSKSLIPVGLIKLLLNGAKEYIDNENEV